MNFNAWKGSRRLYETISSNNLHNNIPIVLFGHVHWGRGAVSTTQHNNQIHRLMMMVVVTAGLPQLLILLGGLMRPI